MINTVDLSALEQNDTVVFRDGQKAIVNHVIECSIDYFTVFLFMINNNRPVHIERDYTKNGVCVAFTYNPEIVEIIKNPKRWSDEDMKAAFDRGIDYATQERDEVPHFRFWLRWYKQESPRERKNETV